MHMLEHWSEQKPKVARTHRTVIARRGIIYSEVDYPQGPPTSGPIYFMTGKVVWLARLHNVVLALNLSAIIYRSFKSSAQYLQWGS